MAFDTYLKIEGAGRRGRIHAPTARGVDRDLLVLLGRLEPQRPSAPARPASGGRQGLDLQLQRHEEDRDIVLAKLFAACCTGQHFDTATVTMRKATGVTAASRPS